MWFLLKIKQKKNVFRKTRCILFKTKYKNAVEYMYKYYYNKTIFRQSILESHLNISVNFNFFQIVNYTNKVQKSQNW